MSATSTPRKKPGYPGSLTDLHRFRKTVHGHNGSSRIVMVRKTDQRTYASREKGQEPKLETITRETVETFRGQRSECKVTTEKKDCEELYPPELIDNLAKSTKKTLSKKRTPIMDFQTECLEAHNEFRAKHGVAPLKLDREICKVAQQWADHLIKQKGLQHSNNSAYGENLFGMSSTNPNFQVSGRQTVESWYAEIKDHVFGKEPDSLISGHFTQVVWKDCEKLGVACARAAGRVVVVANYYPPGNYVGSFAENVPPPGGFSTNNNNTRTDSRTSNNNNNEAASDEELAKIASRISVGGESNAKTGTKGNFEEDFLAAHNEYRRKHGVPPLTLDRKLCKYSQEWAKHLAAKNVLEHRPNCNYGENIYCMTSSNPNFSIAGFEPVDCWYKEVGDHPFGREPNDLKTGHFTQVVWKSSTELGVGVAKNTGQGSIYVVANYSPAGNFVGEYVENVPAPAPAPAQNTAVLRNEAPKTTAVAPSSAHFEFDQFALEGLKVHNEFRRKHGVPDLKLSNELCTYAQEWADVCASTGKMSHRPDNKSYGENIFCVYSSDLTYEPSAKEAVQKWYDEVKKHTFGVENVNRESLHFTQVIWKSSTELGIAKAKNRKGETYVVANYSPRGNYVGQFVQNVPRPRI